MIKESDILKIVKEDILRILGERKEKVSLKSMKVKIKVSPSFMSKATNVLEEEGLISVEKEFTRFTKNGLDEAKDIVKKHLVLENYFRVKKSNTFSRYINRLWYSIRWLSLENNFNFLNNVNKSMHALILSGA